MSGIFYTALQHSWNVLRSQRWADRAAVLPAFWEFLPFPLSMQRLGGEQDLCALSFNRVLIDCTVCHWNVGILICCHNAH